MIIPVIDEGSQAQGRCLTCTKSPISGYTYELIFVGFKSVSLSYMTLVFFFLCKSALTRGPECRVSSLLVFVGGKKVSATLHLRGLK